MLIDISNINKAFIIIIIITITSDSVVIGLGNWFSHCSSHFKRAGFPSQPSQIPAGFYFCLLKLIFNRMDR